jgi:hypothetical protein
MHYQTNATPRPVGIRPKNRLLKGLPDSDFERLSGDLRTVAIERKQVFHPANERIQDVIFLNGGVASVTTMMHDGTMIEVATIGDEGVVGILRKYPNGPA